MTVDEKLAGWVLFDEDGPLASARDRSILDERRAGIYALRRTGLAGVCERAFQVATEAARERDRRHRRNTGQAPAGTLAVEADVAHFMAVYDAPPARAREALAHARVDWSVFGIHAALCSGMSVAQVLAVLAAADVAAAGAERWLNPERVDADST